MSDKLYLLDTNVLIAAHRLYYAFDLVPRFWDRLCGSTTANQWAIIDKVRDEMFPYGDLLVDWIKTEYKGRILDSYAPSIIAAYGQIMQQVANSLQYVQSAKDVFAKGADSWVIAHGMVRDGIIVTNEESRPDAKRRIIIPDICKEFNVQCINTFNFMRAVKIHI